MALQADSGEIGRFVRALFVYAESNTCASLRAFHQTNSKAPSEFIRPVHINGSLGPLIDEATEWATRAAGRDHPVVFCPPICTFLAGQRGRNEDLANGLTLSVEIDQGDTQAARRLLEGLLGVATAVVSSGGEWTNPETGEIHAKLHLHWRLSEPTRDTADHERLRLARDMAGRLAGADPTGKPIVHPLRWPGSWNQKGANPVMARIVQLNESAEINLIEALDALADAVEASGMAAADLPRSSDPTAPLPLLATAMAAIPNHDEHYDTWIRYGYAAFRGAGSEEGRALWETWSRKSAKFNAGEQDAAWSRIHKAILGSSAPRTIGAGTIFFDAARHGWSRPSPEPPPAETDPGWWHSLEHHLTSGVGKLVRMAREASEPPPADGPEETAAVPPFHDPGTSGTPGTAPLPRIVQVAEFMDGFTPPDYVIDGIIRRGSLYALTSPTGHGKTAVALYLACMVGSGRQIGNIQVDQGDVILLAGENPDDVRCRFYAACQNYQISPVTLSVYVLPATFPIDAETAEALRQEIDKLGLTVALIIADTAAAYFHGDDDNHNVQMGAYARNLRVLTTCRGAPAVVTPAHPVKAPDRSNLLPRGGGAFLNELDGNLTLWAEAMGESTTLHWQGKIRGADFAPVNFALRQVTITGLEDSKGRAIVSIIATLQTDAEAEAAAAEVRSDENVVLEWLRRYPRISIKDIAINAGWVSPPPKSIPHKSKVHRLLKSLKADALVAQKRGKWAITDAGKKELEAG